MENHKDGRCLDVPGWTSDGSDAAPNLPLTVYPCYNISWAQGGYDDHVRLFRTSRCGSTISRCQAQTDRDRAYPSCWPPNAPPCEVRTRNVARRLACPHQPISN
jgi:hypothetical protein